VKAAGETDYGDFEGSVRKIGGPTASELGAIEMDA
jgi:hypothetical protein